MEAIWNLEGRVRSDLLWAGSFEHSSRGRNLGWILLRLSTAACLGRGPLLRMTVSHRPSVKHDKGAWPKISASTDSRPHRELPEPLHARGQEVLYKEGLLSLLLGSRATARPGRSDRIKENAVPFKLPFGWNKWTAHAAGNRFVNPEEHITIARFTTKAWTAPTRHDVGQNHIMRAWPFLHSPSRKCRRWPPLTRAKWTEAWCADCFWSLLRHIFASLCAELSGLRTGIEINYTSPWTRERRSEDATFRPPSLAVPLSKKERRSRQAHGAGSWWMNHHAQHWGWRPWRVQGSRSATPRPVLPLVLGVAVRGSPTRTAQREVLL